MKRKRPPKPRCTGHSSRTGKPCRRYPVRGASVCPSHGGSARQVKAAGEAREQGRDAERAVAAYGLARDIEPHEALAEEVRRTAGHVAMLQEVVEGLERDRLVHGVTKTVQLPDGKRHVTVEAAFSVWLSLYHVERKHLLAACATAIRCGVEERRVKLEEQQGAMIAGVFQRVFADESLGLSDEQRRAASVATARHLRVIAGGAA